jgi:GNAT superfamily N-acetyltransferase
VFTSDSQRLKDRRCVRSERAAIETVPAHTMTTLCRPLIRIASLRPAPAWLIRRVRGGDAVAMQRFVEGLDASSRRWRFHGAVKACPALADALIEGDAVWAAFRGKVLIGEARFVRDRADPERAELAMAVADGWQGHGLAAALLATLLVEARRAGVRVLRADVMCDNVRMQRFLQRHGFAPRLQWDGPGDSDVFERRLATPRWQRLTSWLGQAGSAAPRRLSPLLA